MPARPSNRAASVPGPPALVAPAVGALGALAVVFALAACTDGTTPDCADAQCQVVVEATEAGKDGGGGDGEGEDAGDGATGGGAGDGATGGDAGADASAIQADATADGVAPDGALE
jgi:hypothetical protein